MSDGAGDGLSLTPPASLDFVARLADAWNCKGSHIFSASGREHRALCALSYVDASIATLRWEEISGGDRYKLVIGARRAIEFARQCAWIFGEGEGARF